MKKDIIGVYFDFFGTLIDSRYAITNIWSRIAKRLGMNIEYDDPRIWAGMQKQWEESNKLAEKLGKNYINFSREEIDKLNSVVLDIMGIKIDGSNEIAGEEFRENFIKVLRLNPGCRETLKQIKDKNIKIGLLTHGTRKRVQLKLKEFKIFETNQFQKDLKRIDFPKQVKIYNKISDYIYPQLRKNPYYGKNIKKLKSWKPKTWRYRLSNFRLFYEINDKDGIVSIITIEILGKAYQ